MVRFFVKDERIEDFEILPVKDYNIEDYGTPINAIDIPPVLLSFEKHYFICYIPDVYLLRKKFSLF